MSSRRDAVAVCLTCTHYDTLTPSCRYCCHCCCCSHPAAAAASAVRRARVSPQGPLVGGDQSGCGCGATLISLDSGWVLGARNTHDVSHLIFPRSFLSL